jgi:hypothetical protein
MVDLALATNIAPSVWAAEDDASIATALEILAERAEAMQTRRRR